LEEDLVWVVVDGGFSAADDSRIWEFSAADSEG
jgi:hypothetical protein